MTKANEKELASVNMLYNELFDDYSVGYDYQNEGSEITEFKYDEEGNTEIEFFIQWLNDQYAIRSTEKVVTKKMSKEDLNYLLGRKQDEDLLY